MAGYSLLPPEDSWGLFYDTVSRYPEWLDAVIEFLPVRTGDSPREDALPLPAGPEGLPRYLRVVPDTELLIELRVSDELSAVLLDAIHEDT